MSIACNKTRKVDNPYEIWEGHGWTWKVLKKYQKNDDAPYARSFCFVISPYCPEGEYGDVYINDYKNSGTLIKTNYD